MAARIEQIHLAPSDVVDAVASMIERTADHDEHRPIGEHALVELREGPRIKPHAAFIARDGVELVGYAHLSKRETASGWRLEAFIAPEARGRGLAAPLVGEVLEHVAADGGGRIHAWAYRPGPEQGRLAQRFAMRATRRLHRMVRAGQAPEVDLPSGFTLRSFEPGDAEQWLAVHNEAFAEHPDGGGWRSTDLAWHLREPWFDPQGFLLAVDQQGIAAYCWMKPDGDGAGVYFLGVHPRARGSGIAPALCARGIAWGATRGARATVLYVDESNEPAVRLYRRLGFATEHIDVCYELDVPADDRG